MVSSVPASLPVRKWQGSSLDSGARTIHRMPLQRRRLASFRAFTERLLDFLGLFPTDRSAAFSHSEVFRSCFSRVAIDASGKVSLRQ